MSDETITVIVIVKEPNGWYYNGYNKYNSEVTLPKSEYDILSKPVDKGGHGLKLEPKISAENTFKTGTK
jgi:hypothetical protein